MDENQRFILEKVKYGWIKKELKPTSEEDIERLKWDANDYSRIPLEEWNEWSRKTHWALQAAFINDTDRLKNKEKINEWRRICSNIIRDVTEKKRKPLVIDDLTLHFMENDLLHYVIEVFGQKGLTEEEKLWISAFIRKKR
jgi:hypothetical protein